MNIPKLIKGAHEYYVKVGEYDCPECDKGKTIRFACYAGEHTEIIEDCDNCDGTDIDPNKNIGSQLMNIVIELGEVAEIHKQGRFADWESYERGIQQLKKSCSMWKDIEGDMMFTKEGRNYFLAYIESTFGDKIADVFIRLLDLCGYLNKQKDYHDIMSRYENHDRELSVIGADNVGQWMFDFTTFELRMIMSDIKHKISSVPSIGSALAELDEFCDFHNIPIEKHIKAKIAYNRLKETK